jgi:hypothetical protein
VSEFRADDPDALVQTDTDRTSPLPPPSSCCTAAMSSCRLSRLAAASSLLLLALLLVSTVSHVESAMNPPDNATDPNHLGAQVVYVQMQMIEISNIDGSSHTSSCVARVTVAAFRSCVRCRVEHCRGEMIRTPRARRRHAHCMLCFIHSSVGRCRAGLPRRLLHALDVGRTGQQRQR